MRCNLLSSYNARWLLLLSALCLCMKATAHGGVYMEDDLCIIQIDFFQAHFTVYQPQTRANKEYCEDIPDVTDTVFVLDYLHNSLKEMPLDFRIIRDIKDLGRFAKWEDIAQIEDLDHATVFYQPPVRRPNAVFTVEYKFEEPGNYIGIVTTRHPTKDKIYRAVFPFEVGNTGFGYLALFIGLVILVQFNYWFMSGGLGRWRAKHAMAARMRE